MKKLALAMIAAVVFALTFAGCKARQAPNIDMTNVDIQIGTPREEVLKMLGEPDEELLERHGEVFSIDRHTVVIYYEIDENGDAVVSQMKVDR